MKSIDVSRVPMYIDGSNGSMWLAHSKMWPQVLGDPERERRYYISVFDLIKLLEDAGIKLVYGQPEPEKT